jgi:hypothetical protein
MANSLSYRKIIDGQKQANIAPNLGILAKKLGRAFCRQHLMDLRHHRMRERERNFSVAAPLTSMSYGRPIVSGGGFFILCGVMLTMALEARAGPLAFPIYIPQECVALAQREGVPMLIENKYQAAKARYKLYRLTTSDPLVRECRAAVDRVRRAAVAKD